jgi:hypothetical protein
VAQTVGDRRDVFRVTDAAQARLLLDRRFTRYVAPFMERPRSITDAAEILGVSGPFLLQRVRRLERLNLVEVVEVLKRKGRGIKLYQAVGSEFFIPFAIVELADLEVHTRAFVELLYASFVDLVAQYAPFVPDPGFKIDYRESRLRLNGRIDSESTIDMSSPLAPAAMDEWRWPRLSPERAKRLQLDLLQLLTEAIKDDDPAEEPCLINMRMAPVSKRVDRSAIS